MFMMLKNTPYKWLAYLVGWFIFESFIGYSKRYDLTQESFTVFVLISLLVNSICSYRFGKEKGKIAGVLIFIIGLVICILIAFFYICSGIGSKYDALGLQTYIDNILSLLHPFERRVSNKIYFDGIGLPINYPQRRIILNLKK